MSESLVSRGTKIVADFELGLARPGPSSSSNNINIKSCRNDNKSSIDLFDDGLEIRSIKVGSVTRFVIISPLWQKMSCLWQFFDSLFLIWQNVESTFVNFGWPP